MLKNTLDSCHASLKQKSKARPYYKETLFDLQQVETHHKTSFISIIKQVSDKVVQSCVVH